MTYQDTKSPRSGSETKASCCQSICQSRVCLPVVVVAVLAGVAVAVAVVLTSGEVRDRFPPDMKWWQRAVVYQIYPRSFKDSDGNGVGDLRGIMSELDYLTYLGVDAIWISPFYPSPMADFGYDVSNYTDVDPLFGNINDFDTLVKEAHDKDIRVIIDFVAGHTSSQHPWFNRSVRGIPPYDDYYIWTNGTTLDNGSVVPPSNWMSVFGDSSWEWSDARQQYYYHAYLVSQPTLNYRNPHVQEEMKNVLRFWLGRGVDGIRVDAVGNIMVDSDYYQDQARSFKPGTEKWQKDYYINNLTHDVPEIGPIVSSWRQVLQAYDDNDDTDNAKLMIVEMYEEPQVRIKYFDYGADLPFNFQLAMATSRRDNKSCDALCLRDVIQREYDALPAGKWPNFVLSNHDQPRAGSRVGPRYVDALNMLLLTLRGTPTSYYGEELGMRDISVTYNDTQDPFGKRYGPAHYQEVSRDPERSPMQWNSEPQAGFTNFSTPWLPIHPDYPTVNVQTERNSTNMTSVKVYRDLAFLRQQASLRYGKIQFAVVTSGILSYIRSANGRPNYLVAVNLGNATETHDFSPPPVNQGQGLVKVVTSDAANEGRFGKDLTVSLASLRLDPGDGLVVELDPSSSS